MSTPFFCVKITVWYSPCEFIQWTSMKTSVLQLTRQSLVCETDVVVVKRVEFPALIRRDIVISDLFVVCSVNVFLSCANRQCSSNHHRCRSSDAADIYYLKQLQRRFVLCAFAHCPEWCIACFWSIVNIFLSIRNTTGRESTSAVYFWKCQFTLLLLVYRSQTNDKGK